MEPTAEVNKTKICPRNTKNCKYYYLPMQLLKYFSVFQHIFMFQRESISGYHDIKQKNGHKTKRWG